MKHIKATSRAMPTRADLRGAMVYFCIGFQMLLGKEEGDAVDKCCNKYSVC